MYYKGSTEKNKLKNKEIQEVIQYMQYNVDYCIIYVRTQWHMLIEL